MTQLPNCLKWIFQTLYVYRLQLHSKHLHVFCGLNHIESFSPCTLSQVFNKLTLNYHELPI